METKINCKAHIPSNKHMDGATCLNGAGIIELTKEYVKEMDQKTRKIVTMYGYIQDRKLSGYTHHVLKMVGGLYQQKTVSVMKGKA